MLPSVVLERPVHKSCPHLGQGCLLPSGTPEGQVGGARLENGAGLGQIQLHIMEKILL